MSVFKKKLIHFIEKHHKDSQYVFWPDKPSSHYAKIVTAYLDDHNIKCVPKKINTTNLLELQCIANNVKGFQTY